MDPSDSGFLSRLSADRFGEFAWGRTGHLPAHLVGMRPVGESGQVGGVGDGVTIEEVAHGGHQPRPADGGRERDAGLLFAQAPEIVGGERDRARDRRHIEVVGHPAGHDFDRLPQLGVNESRLLRSAKLVDEKIRSGVRTVAKTICPIARVAPPARPPTMSAPITPEPV